MFAIAFASYLVVRRFFFHSGGDNLFFFCYATADRLLFIYIFLFALLAQGALALSPFFFSFFSSFFSTCCSWTHLVRTAC